MIIAARAAFYQYIPPLQDSLDLNGQILGLFCNRIQVGYIFYWYNKATKVYKKLVCLKSKKNTRQNSKRGCCLGIYERKSKNIDQCEKKLDDMEDNMRTEQRSVAGKMKIIKNGVCSELIFFFWNHSASFFIAYVVTSGWTQTFSSEFFQILLFSLLGITYFFLAPLILHFVLIYYGVGFIIYRNQLLNGYAPKFETGLVYWGLVLTKQQVSYSCDPPRISGVQGKETKATVKFQLKKVFCMGVAVGNLDMEEQLFQNIQMSVNLLVSLLQKNWQNLRCLSLKSTMGKMQSIFREPFLCVLEF
ncbi:hypothetical protein OROMI_003467 [Orobanche minor]